MAGSCQDAQGKCQQQEQHPKQLHNFEELPQSRIIPNVCIIVVELRNFGSFDGVPQADRIQAQIHPHVEGHI